MLVVMAAIFLFSAQPGSQSYQLSAQLAGQLQQEHLQQATPAWFSADFHANLRKWAHVWMYALLGVSSALTVCSFRRPRADSWRGTMASAAIALAICLCYAASDELHQLFVPGRACMAADLLVDAAGFVPCAVLASALWHWLHRRAAK